MNMAIVTRSLRFISALLTLSLLVVISACGASPGTSGAASSPATSVSADQQATTTQPGPAQQLSGVIIEGLRSTCRILQTSQRRYALTGAASQRLRQGDKVTVTGVVRTDLINPCGLTFVVTSTR